jgi:hypothetical protein
MPKTAISFLIGIVCGLTVTSAFFAAELEAQRLSSQARRSNMARTHRANTFAMLKMFRFVGRMRRRQQDHLR